jgi:hypothetical protein
LPLTRAGITLNLREEHLLYPDDRVRLIRDISEHELRGNAEGIVESVLRDDDSNFVAVKARFYSASGTKIATLPLDAFELVVSPNLQHRTAVFWGLSLPRQKLIETAMHSILDRGFLMREGLNVAQLTYDAHERWWKWGERISDPAGAETVVSGPAWDGGVVAFSGRQRFQLEFRLNGPGPCLLLHERETVYAEQVRETSSAMTLSRVLTNLYFAVGADFCAFPVADAWLMDQDWNSLLRAPYYPDFFLLPDAACPQDCAEFFRVGRLTESRVMLASLPIKFSPIDDTIQRTDQELQLDALRKCHSLGEKYYGQMYETRFNLNGLYSSVKDAFIDAISIANQLGLKEEAGKLESRLDHIKSVFRSQFS